MRKKKLTGLFFGSFNPIHVGHLVIANHIMEFNHPDEIWFVVSPQNPHKPKETLLDDYTRLELVNLAITDNPAFRACDIEFRMPKPSYTVNTLVYLTEKYPERDFALIMGSDNLETLPAWKNSSEILRMIKSIFVYPRPKHDGGSLKNDPRVSISCAPLMEISASYIRNSIKQGKDMRYILPAGVYEYVKKMNLFR
ncbi:MAG: nicotinate-nucleotide adenylyltransferase [Bacteroidetes bacterium]|nr:nicotinate-nucleotide adenylyltransferase [Bacteroidota bacterium]MBU1719270.1 nicotinate-nucleotide adenylyltransferase [Bacteroidota bacterium]